MHTLNAELLPQPKVALKVANEIKERGTDLFKKGNFEQAQKKYIKALRCT